MGDEKQIDKNRTSFNFYRFNGWLSVGTTLAEGERIHCNFVKPHKALEGQTPAEACGIKVNGNNKWLALIQNAKLAEKSVKANPSTLDEFATES